MPLLKRLFSSKVSLSCRIHRNTESYFGHIRRKVTTYYKQFLLITVVKRNHPWAIADAVMINLTFDDLDVSYPELLK